MFKNLRSIPWEPGFHWVHSSSLAAEEINIHHEDFPDRVPATLKTLESPTVGAESRTPVAQHLLTTHALVFGDQPFGGKFRDVNVTVGGRTAPDWRIVETLMEHLVAHYPALDDLETLWNWYYDFETLHPFQDGNGRVGGITVAARSHALFPRKGWLAPEQ